MENAVLLNWHNVELVNDLYKKIATTELGVPALPGLSKE